MSTATPSIPTLSQLRKQHGYAVAEIAQACKVTTQTIYAWESGKVRPRAPQTRYLCGLYKINMSDLTEVLDATAAAARD